MWFLLTVLCFVTVKFTESDTRFTHINCKVLEPEYLFFEECDLKVMGRGIIALNVKIKYRRGTQRNMINLSLWRRYNGFRPFMFNLTFDICNVMAVTNKKLSFEKIFFDALLKDSNLNHSCPFGDTIVVRNLIFKEDFMKFLPLPDGEYKYQIKHADVNRWLLQVDVKIERKTE